MLHGKLKKENVVRVFKVFKEKILDVKKVIGMKVVKRRERKEGAWTDEVRESVRKEKGSIYIRTIQRNTPEEIK